MCFEGTYASSDLKQQNNPSEVSRQFKIKFHMTLFFPESEQIPFVGEDICALAYQQADLERVSNSDAGSVTSVDADNPKRLERWEDSHVRLLIASYSTFKNLLGKGKTTN